MPAVGQCRICAVAAGKRRRWATHECCYHPTGEACLYPTDTSRRPPAGRSETGPYRSNTPDAQPDQKAGPNTVPQESLQRTGGRNGPLAGSEALPPGATHEGRETQRMAERRGSVTVSGSRRRSIQPDAGWRALSLRAGHRDGEARSCVRATRDATRSRGALRLAVEDEPRPPQLAENTVGTEAREPTHQDTLTGMRTSPPGGTAARSAGGRASPCSRYDSTSFRATS